MSGVRVGYTENIVMIRTNGTGALTSREITARTYDRLRKGIGPVFMKK